eukprot:6172777-Pleurochrysis_carterae.AAC.3
MVGNCLDEVSKPTRPILRALAHSRSHTRSHIRDGSTSMHTGNQAHMLQPVQACRNQSFQVVQKHLNYLGAILIASMTKYDQSD